MREASESRARSALYIFWLFNPFVAIISARGNADTLICFAVALTLHLIQQNKVRCFFENMHLHYEHLLYVF